MAFNFKRFWAGINLKAKTTSSADTKGDLEVIDSTGKLGYHNGSTVSPVVTESHSSTLTNKTIDADANTITNIDNVDIKALAAIDASKIADGSVSSTEFQYLANVTSDIQTQINLVGTALSDHLADPTDAHDASAISVAPIVNLTATDVQAAFAEHQIEIENVISDLGMHILDAVDAHDASAISVIPTGNLAADDAQEAFDELQTDIDNLQTQINSLPDPMEYKGIWDASTNTPSLTDGTGNNGDVYFVGTAGTQFTPSLSFEIGDKVVYNSATAKYEKWDMTDAVSSVFGRVGVVSAQTGDYTASQVTNVPSGNLTATDQQAANNELQSDIDTRATTATLSAHTGASSGVHGVVGSVVGTSDTQTLSNKSFSDSVTIAEIATPSTPASGFGRVYFKADGKLYQLNDSGIETEVGSGAGGGTSDPDALLIQNFDESVLGDFTQTGLSLITSNTLHGTKTALLTHTGSTQSFKQIVAVDPKFRGVNLTASLLMRSTAAEGNVTILVTDETNAVTLTSQSLQTDSQIVSGLSRTIASPTISGFTNEVINGLSVGMSVTGTAIPANTRILSISTTALTITLTANATATLASTASVSISALPKTLQLGFNVPANCLSLSYTISALADSGQETYIDDVVFRNYFLGTSVQGQSEIQVPVITTQSSYVTNSTAVAAGSSVTGVTSTTGGNSSSIYSYNSGTGLYTILENCVFSISAALTTSNATPIQSRIAKNGSVVMADGSNASGIGFSATTSWSGDAIVGDTFLVSNGNGTTSSNNVTATATAYSTDSITVNEIVPARSVLGNTTIDVPVLTDWAAYTPTFTGFGTPSAVEFQWRRNGENVDIRGKHVNGTSTATEARISLPNGYTSATTSRIPSIQMIGQGQRSNTNATGIITGSAYSVLIEPSVSYLTFSSYGGSFGGTTKRNANDIFGTGETVFIFASVPVTGLTATEEIVVSGTQSALIQDADFELKTAGNAGQAITAAVTDIPFIVANSRGVSASWSGSALTIIEDGIYSFEGMAFYSANATHAIDMYIGGVLNKRVGPAIAALTTAPISHVGYFTAGQVISFRESQGAGHTLVNNSVYHYLNITKQGALKVASVNADQKITIPTSELRFEGSSSRGSVATAIVKFDTQAKIRGDAFTVTNTVADGTVITMRKAGKLDVGSDLYSATLIQLYVSKNQAVLTSVPTASESMGTSYSSSNGGVPHAHASFMVNIGDIIRIAASGTPSAYSTNSLQLVFQEQSVQVSVSNTLPQFSESDSSVRLDTANGFGSTGTQIRRFSNIRDNIGVDIEYTDSATAGSSFTVRESGIYSVTYTENGSGAASFFAITKNQSNLTTAPAALTATERLSMGVLDAIASYAETISWQGYLVKGDVIRANGNNYAAGTNDRTSFTMSKVGKPNVTGVNVTPFISIPQPLSQSVILTRSSATVLQTTDLSTIVTSNTNTGLFSLSATGVTALKNIKISASIYCNGTASAAGQAHDVLIYKNGAIRANDRMYSVSNVQSSNSTAFDGELLVGETLTFYGAGPISTQTVGINVVAEALSDQILTAPETFSSDTAAFTYAGSATYTLATLNTAPVGTYITYTYAASTNTRTQTTTRPTQTDADMNANGVLIYPRAFNVASTAAQPSTIAIQIGKGLKGHSLSVYKSAGKSGAEGGLDFYTDAVTGQGARYKTYNEVTGVLLVDVGVWDSSVTSATIAFNDITAGASGYLVINASKNPALTGLNINQVGARVVQSSGQAIASATQVTLTWDASKSFDTHGAFNASTGVYTVPETGYYSIDGSILFNSGTWSSGEIMDMNIYRNGVVVKSNRQPAATGTTNYGAEVHDILFLAKGDTIYFTVFQNSTAKTLLTSTSWNSAAIFKL